MSGKAQLQEARRVEVSFHGKHVLHDGGQRAAHLSVADSFGESVFPGGHGQGLEGSHAVDHGASESGVGAFGRDQAFEEYVEALHALRGDGGPEAAGLAGFEHFDVHGMDDVGVVIVEGHLRSVGVPSVAEIPFVDLVDGNGQGILVGFFADAHQEGFGHGAEEQPVVVGRTDHSQFLEALDVALLRFLVELLPGGFGSPQEAFGQIGCIYQNLRGAFPEQAVGACGIDGVAVCLQRPLTELAAAASFGGVVVGLREPGGDACHQAAEGLHVGHPPVASVPGWAQLQLHVLLEFSPAHVFQHRPGDAVTEVGPLLAVAGYRSGLFTGLNIPCHGAGQHNHQDNTDSVCQYSLDIVVDGVRGMSVHYLVYKKVIDYLFVSSKNTCFMGRPIQA